MKMIELVAPCHFGMEAVLKREILDLGYEISQVEDGRVTYISITEEGRALSRKYNDDVFNSLIEPLSGISEEDAGTMIQTIETFYQVMCERRDHFEKY